MMFNEKNESESLIGRQIADQINSILDKYAIAFLVVDGIGTVMALPSCPRDCFELLKIRDVIGPKLLVEKLEYEAKKRVCLMDYGYENLYYHAIRVITEGYWR